MDNQPLLLFGILEHEHKMSVSNVILKRTKNNEEPIQSKQRLIFQCGFQRFTSCPIFSQHTNGNKHKVNDFDLKTLSNLKKFNRKFNFSVRKIFST